MAELERHGQLSLNLDHVYRSMDLIDEAAVEAIRRRSRPAHGTHFVLDLLIPPW